MSGLYAYFSDRIWVQRYNKYTMIRTMEVARLRSVIFLVIVRSLEASLRVDYGCNVRTCNKKGLVRTDWDEQTDSRQAKQTGGYPGGEDIVHLTSLASFPHQYGKAKDEEHVDNDRTQERAPHDDVLPLH